MVMKCFVAVYFLASILCSCVQAKGFRIGDFFFGSGDHDDAIKRSSEPEILPRSEESSNKNTTIPLDSESEIDSTIANSTFSEEFVDQYLLNSSESLGSSQNSSILEGDNATTKQSVKKQLSNNLTPSSTTAQSDHVIEQNNSNLGSIKDSATSSADGLNVTSNTDELEEVVLGTTKAPAVPDEKTIFQKSIEWVEDTYTLSILIPVAAGVLFATTCIVTIAICGCLRRCCRRRRLRRKILPDSVKSLRASDRKRLLGDCSSDEEF